MAPALPLAPREPPEIDHDDIEDAEKQLSHRRRALASVDNFATHMEEDDMGLQNQPSLAKDSQEMEQILVDLGSSDLAQADLLQAIKTLESGGDALSTGDPDAIFPLSGFDLPETIDSEGDAAEDKIKVVQSRLERRCAFLQRRLRILQARAIGKRISEEAAQTFEKCTRGARKDGSGRPVGLKALLKRIETTAALQASAASRSAIGPKYYNAGTSKGDASRSASVGIASGTLAGLEDTAGALRSHLSAVKYELDSDATASSSGAESNDEAVSYNNPHQQHMPIEKRALWSWQRERASIASRWCWLQAQVQELEYKIRQHNDLHKQVREAKGPVEFEGQPAGYEGSLPGSAVPDDDPSLETCARVRPLRRETFKKRKLLQMHNLHIATKKAAKPSDIKCSCQYPLESCPVCTGRAESTQPMPPFTTLPPKQKIALVDPGYHPVLSDIKDVSPSIHASALSSRSWFRGRSSRPAPRHASAARASHHLHMTPKPLKRHPTRLKRGRPPLSRKIKERERDEETSTSGQERFRGRASTESRSWRRQSYDIDNIVIPQSVAANTRPQILTYKEIITPKWRVLEISEVSLNNGIARATNRISVESEEEDVSETAVQARHSRAEWRERGRFARKLRTRRSQPCDAPLDVALDVPAAPPDVPSDVPAAPPDVPLDVPSDVPAALPVVPAAPPDVSSDVSAAPPDVPAAPRDVPSDVPAVPNSELQLRPPPPPLIEYETVRPYTPRQFPLPNDAYVVMLSAMPDGYRPSSPEPTRSHLDDDGSSTLSPLSPTAFDGDDPDDAEWEPNIEKVKTERRKSAFR